MNDLSTIKYTLFRQEPILRDSVLREIKYNTPDGVKRINEVHFFNVNEEFELLSNNMNHLLMLRRFANERDILPTKSQPEYLMHYHPGNLPKDAAWEDIDKRCNKVTGIPLAWAPKFINLIRDEVAYACKQLNIQFNRNIDWKMESNAINTPTHYPIRYWVLMEYQHRKDSTKESITDIKNYVSYYFLGTVARL